MPSSRWHTIPCMTPTTLILVALLAALATVSPASAQSARTVDIPTRPGVTQRFLVITPEQPKAAVILFAGGDGGLSLSAEGGMQNLGGNFLVRSRQLFVNQGFTTVVIDAPSDRQSYPFLSGQRQTPAHVADVKAVMAWLRAQAKIPVWLIGTSRGTQSAGYIATQLPPADGGPDGIVLTSTILNDSGSRAVPEMALDRIQVPVLVAHHRHDGCRVTLHGDLPRLMTKLTTPPRKELMVFEGGIDQGNPCQARGHHGFNGIEREVVGRIAQWMTAP